MLEMGFDRANKKVLKLIDKDTDMLPNFLCYMPSDANDSAEMLRRKKGFEGQVSAAIELAKVAFKWTGAYTNKRRREMFEEIAEVFKV